MYKMNTAFWMYKSVCSIEWMVLLYSWNNNVVKMYELVIGLQINLNLSLNLNYFFKECENFC